jgi:arylsulfatase A-like enzyme
LEEINYFGYAETTLSSHIRDYIKQVHEGGKRMFLSHFTSTTHHPFGVPKSFNSTDYLNTKDSIHEDFNKYLNTMRFTDAWLGNLLQIFDDLGISNETLVVFVGDHGQAFAEDVPSKTGTYGNGHISNFRVPITFRHPNLPRVQYNANATSLSILPTILDLLINSNSLNEKDTEVASELIYDYEGQSLIRPYKNSHNGRRSWNFGIINGGGSLLSVTSADAPWRLVLPLDDKSEYRFTDLKNDPLELKPLEKWSKDDLVSIVTSQYGEGASQWVVEAEAVSRWWGLERKRLWNYNPGESGDKK